MGERSSERLAGVLFGTLEEGEPEPSLTVLRTGLRSSLFPLGHGRILARPVTSSTRDELRVLDGGRDPAADHDSTLLDRLVLWLADVSAEAFLAARPEPLPVEDESLEPAS